MNKNSNNDKSESLSMFLKRHGFKDYIAIENVYFKDSENGIREYAREIVGNNEEPSHHTYEDEILTYVREWKRL